MSKSRKLSWVMGGITVVVGVLSEDGLKTMLLGGLILVLICLDDIRDVILEAKKERE